jgi:putative chitinase
LADRERYFAKAVAVLGTSSHSAIASGQEQSRTPASESVRSNYDPNSPVDWENPRCKVSRYFTVAEVTQNDPRRIPPKGSEIEENILSLAKELDRVREEWGSPIGVTSWYRPPAINAEVRGATNSQHIYGKAADIYTMDAPDQWHPRNQEFEKWLDEVAWHNRYLGKGCASNKGFTHLDLRPGHERWNY